MIDFSAKAKNFIDSKLRISTYDEKTMMNFLRNKIIEWQAEVEDLKYLNPFEEDEYEKIQIRTYKEHQIRYGQQILSKYHQEQFILSRPKTLTV